MKRILITAVHFPPCQLIGAKRPFKMAEFLSDAGWDVTVLTVKSELTPPIGGLKVGDMGFEVIRTGAFVPYVALKNRAKSNRRSAGLSTSNMARGSANRPEVCHKFRTTISYLVRKSLTSLDQLDSWSGWRRSALKAVKRRSSKYDVVLSTIPPFSTALLGRQLADYYKCKFVLDYRDPWSDIIHLGFSHGRLSAKKLKQHRDLEDECLKSSDLVLTVSPGITRLLRGRVNKKILTIPQGFTGEVAENSYDKESQYLLYAGSLAYGRDLSGALAAIKNYVESYRKPLKLVYCGTDSGTAYEQACSVGASAYLESKGAIPESEVLGYANRSLCNLVIISPGYEYAYPGKLFELIPAGRPIYVISSIDSEAGRLVEKYELGRSIVGSDIVSLAHDLNNEIYNEYEILQEVNYLKVENIYTRMIEEGLNGL
jgi:hypothetical protein